MYYSLSELLTLHIQEHRSVWYPTRARIKFVSHPLFFAYYILPTHWYIDTAYTKTQKLLNSNEDTHEPFYPLVYWYYILLSPWCIDAIYTKTRSHLKFIEKTHQRFHSLMHWYYIYLRTDTLTLHIQKHKSIRNPTRTRTKFVSHPPWVSYYILPTHWYIDTACTKIWKHPKSNENAHQAVHSLDSW